MQAQVMPSKLDDGMYPEGFPDIEEFRAGQHVDDHNDGANDDDECDDQSEAGREDSGRDPVEERLNKMHGESTLASTRLLYALMVLGCFGVVGNKWLLAVAMRKIFIWLEETFVGTASLFGMSTSPFWNALFLKNLSFYHVIASTCASSGLIAVCTSTLQALPVRLAGATARARRELVLDVSLNSMLLAERGYSAPLLLEHINLLYEYEANTMYVRKSATITITVAALACFVVFWQGGLLGIATGLCLLVTLYAQRKVLTPFQNRRAELLEGVHTSILDALRAADVVSMHNMEDEEKQTLKVQEKATSKVEGTIASLMVVMGVPTMFGLVVSMPLTLVVAWEIFQGSSDAEETINTMFALLATFFMFDEAHKSFTRITLTDQQASIYAQTRQAVYAALVDGQADLDAFDRDHPGSPPDVEPGSLVFTDVSIRYPDADGPAVQGVSFTIPQGSTMAIVAESGGGKSTLFRAASALVRFEGKIYCGSVPLGRATRRAIRARMGFVSQDSKLFARSIRENIWYGNRSEPDDSKIWEVLDQVGLASWVDSRKEGLDTVLASERVVSGGQAQRLQIARLLCRQGLHYVLLDECMSALDPAMRGQITRVLRRFLVDKTAFVITHSHETVSDLCHHVVHLGKLQEEDPNAVLPTAKYLALIGVEQKAKRR